MDKYQTKAKRLLITILMLCTVFMGIIAGSKAYAELAPQTKFEKINVMRDLEDGKINFDKYPFSNVDSIYRPGIMQFVEYCYSPFSNMQGNYGLYVYFYNPKNTNFVEKSNQNKIQIATKFDEKLSPTNYETYDLEFCNKSGEDPDPTVRENDANQYNKFLKFKIANSEDFLKTVNSESRKYAVSGITLLEKGQQNGYEYKVGGIYSFSGYARGYGPNPEADDTLKCHYDKLETIIIRPEDIGQTSYNFKQNNSKGTGWHNQINAVYFSVPNYILDDYERLQSVKFETYRYKTAPIFVTKPDSGLHDAFFNNRGNIYGTNGWNIDDTFMANVKDTAWGQLSTFADIVFGKFAFTNADTPLVPIIDKHPGKSILRVNQLPYVFEKNFPDNKDDQFLEVITSKELLDYIYKYNASYHNGRLPHRQSLSADLFIKSNDDPKIKKTIDAGENKTLFNLNIKESNFWDKFFGITHKEEYMLNIDPIEMINHDNYNTDTLYINSNDIAEFNAKVGIATAKERTMHMFRFAIDEYYSSYVHKYSTGPSKYVNSFMAQTTAYLDFDIIELGFVKDGKYTMFPVVMSPMDVISGINSPSEKLPGTDFPWWIIILLLVLLVLSPILYFLLPPLFTLIGHVIALPFKAIGALFKGGKKKKKNQNQEVVVKIVNESNGTKKQAKKAKKSKEK